MILNCMVIVKTNAQESSRTRANAYSTKLIQENQMFKSLSPYALGIQVNNLQEAIDVASKAGFEGVEFNAAEVADLVDAHGPEHVKSMFTTAGLRPAGWSLTADYRKDEAT